MFRYFGGNGKTAVGYEIISSVEPIEPGEVEDLLPKDNARHPRIFKAATSLWKKGVFYTLLIL